MSAATGCSLKGWFRDDFCKAFEQSNPQILSFSTDNLVHLKSSAEYILASCQEYCVKLYSNSNKADEVCDRMYGISLLKYINDKDIKDIQLTKREYQS